MAVSYHELMYIYYSASVFYAIRTFDEFRRIVCRSLVQFTGKFFNITAGQSVLGFPDSGRAAGERVQ